MPRGGATVGRVGYGGRAPRDGTVVDTSWTFFDDGELLATGDWNPYFPELFLVDHTKNSPLPYPNGPLPAYFPAYCQIP